jgi:hypothetical protein
LVRPALPRLALLALLARQARLAPIAAGLAAALAAGSASAAQPKDAQAEKALADAMDNDYLQTAFGKAEKKLRTAIEACGPAGCTPALKAKLYVALASVLAGGKKQLEDAREAFVEALTIDKDAKPDPDILSSEIAFVYEQARKQLKLDQPASAAQAVKHTPPAEQRVMTPVPIFIEVGPELAATAKRATVSYLAPGAPEWRSLLMKKIGERGFGMNVPCADLEAEGALRYHIIVTDESGAVLATAGTRGEPLATEMKKSIAGEPPHWPGFAPPEPCAKTEKAKAQQCIDDKECNTGFQCDAGVCVAKPPPGPEPKDDRRLNWITLSIVPDASLFSGESVCTEEVQARDHFVCLRQDGSRYRGTPTAGIANNVNLGFTFSSLRATLGFDRVILDNFTAGLRAGAALAGPSHESVSFFRLHFEARAGYWFGPKPFESMGARPYVFLAGGAAQVNSKVEVEVLEDGDVCGAMNTADTASECTLASPDGVREPRTQKLSAYKQAGLGFLSVGGGIAYAPLPAVALNFAVRASVTLPVVTAVFSPEMGLSVGF